MRDQNMILWFTGIGPIEVFVVDQEKEKIRYAMPILIRHMATKTFIPKLVRELSSR